MSSAKSTHSYEKNSAYRSLGAPRIIDTATAIKGRIQDRFPNAGLNKIAREVEVVALESAERAAWCAEPQWQIRGLAIAFAFVGIMGIIFFLSQIHVKMSAESVSQLLQDIYNALNDTILFVIGLVFLWGWERRIKRARALKAMHELRSLAHIVDMHQLTKDHESLFTQASREAAAKGLMTNHDLVRYLILQRSSRVTGQDCRSLRPGTGRWHRSGCRDRNRKPFHGLVAKNLATNHPRGR